MAYGPYIHKINKGGLEEIIRDQQLISTAARQIAGGGEAVRATPGSMAEYMKQRNVEKADKGEQYIEFYTVVAPRTGTPPGLALWPIEEGKYLKIKVTAIFDEFGIRRI